MLIFVVKYIVVTALDRFLVWTWLHYVSILSVLAGYLQSCTCRIH